MIMKQKILAVSVAAALTGGITGSASAALVVEGNGVGHALIVPYFSTQGTNVTLLNIVNTDTVNGKAVKVRFRSGVDSDDIFDFQVFLSPGDVWTANVSQGSSGLSQMNTTDKSCTLPSNINQAFVTARLASYTDQVGTVHGVNEQTREGYVEIFNMADIPKFLSATTGGYVATTSVNPLYTAIKHVNGVAPCTQATLLGIEAVGGAVISPALATAGGGTIGAANYTATQQVFPPTGTLFGNVTIINVPRTLAWTDGMDAIRANGINTATSVADARTIVVYSGQSGISRASSHSATLPAGDSSAFTFPALNMTEDGVLLNYLQNGVIPADYDFPDMSSPYEVSPGTIVSPGTQAVALSAGIARAAVVNEFLTDATVNAGTDWVISIPTRRYHVSGRAAAYGGTTGTAATAGYPSSEVLQSIGGTGIPGGPTGLFAARTTYASDGRSACVSTGSSPAYFDREEIGATAGGAVISPGSPTTYSLCGEVNVLSWNNATFPTPSLSATLIVANSSAGTITAGWARQAMGLAGAQLPVLGAAYGRAINTGVTPNVYFGGTYKHRFQ